MTSLSPRLPFINDETHLSWVNRLAVFHAGGSAASFIKDLGLKERGVRCGDEAQIRALCEIAGEDAEGVLRNTVKRAGKEGALGHIGLGNTCLPYGNLRFCPDCLIEDGQGARNINSARRVRLIWSFSFVHTCPVHHLPLIARNDPAYTLIKPLMELVPQDGEALARLRDGLTRSPPSGLQDYLVARLRSRTVGPLWLDQQSIDQVATATVLLGGLLRYGADSLIKDYDDDLAARDGWEWMSRGPEAVRGALERFRALHTVRCGRESEAWCRRPDSCQL